MKRIIFILVFVFFNLGNAQTKEISETELYEKAEKAVEEYYEKCFEADSLKYIQKAYDCYSELVKHFPNSEKRKVYIYSKGLYSQNNEDAKKCFIEVIQINDNNWLYYIRESYMKLTWYAIKEKEFKTAEKYLNIIDKMKKPSFSCGVEFDVYYSRLKNLRKRCEEGLKN
ncbi:hypothetical protein H9X57_00350 [Flavobacterium piscinae]|uniref:Tetratricopeptide repeat protein n=1 Tax=Flavobacterium piscinae TaxID=2506424 RepID=A0A4Q1KI21_9FLAO|nr:hypothetical protein [Flavobacterium piscinae]MBC8882430.1 hypothetical protein [Flavobacterium piscinae]RXR28910.1 hypothetical protein EQG68_13840 [Flavobacterium piscinae]